MRAKIFLLSISILLIIILAMFGFGIKEKALQGIIEGVDEYNCKNNSLCSSCIIRGNVCVCSNNICNCGNESYGKSVCDFGS